MSAISIDDQNLGRDTQLTDAALDVVSGGGGGEPVVVVVDGMVTIELETCIPSKRGSKR